MWKNDDQQKMSTLVRIAGRLGLMTGYFETMIRAKRLQQRQEAEAVALEAISAMSNSSFFDVRSHEGMPNDRVSESTVKDLQKLFEQRGSDKSTRHNYHEVYGRILSVRGSAKFNLMEIGLGTNNLRIPSNMGKQGSPGASLRAFRDWCASCYVYGADVDPDILFTEERINTSFVDQRDSESLRVLFKQFVGPFYLIIDDGYHHPVAGFPTRPARTLGALR